MNRRGALPVRISAARFKATCLELVDAVEHTGASIVVTKRGRPVAQLAPVREHVESAFGLMKGRIVVRADLAEPIDVTWNASSWATFRSS